MPKYTCPVCKKPLTKKQWEEALGILHERERHQDTKIEKLHQQLKDAIRNQQIAKTEGLKLGEEKAEKKTKRMVQGYESKLKAMAQRIEQLERGTTPQTEGLEFEETLTTRLRKEFPHDHIQRKGKGGDVLHVVIADGNPIGTIIYECKRTTRISGQHIRQAALAKRQRSADFAIVVTTGSRKGFSGLATEGGVLIVAPLGVISLASLLRQQLLEIAKAGVISEQRSAIVARLLKYITGPQFKTPIEAVVQHSRELQKMIHDEAAQHVRTWKKRWECYKRIEWDSTQVQYAVGVVLQGKEPKHIAPPRTPPLQLPESSLRALAAKAGE